MGWFSSLLLLRPGLAPYYKGLCVNNWVAAKPMLQMAYFFCGDSKQTPMCLGYLLLFFHSTCIILYLDNHIQVTITIKYA